MPIFNVRFAEDKSEKRHEYIADKAVYNRLERRTHDERDGELNDIAFAYKYLEVLEKPALGFGYCVQKFFGTLCTFLFDFLFFFDLFFFFCIHDNTIHPRKTIYKTLFIVVLLYMAIFRIIMRILWFPATFAMTILLYIILGRGAFKKIANEHKEDIIIRDAKYVGNGMVFRIFAVISLIFALLIFFLAERTIEIILLVCGLVAFSAVFSVVTFKANQKDKEQKAIEDDIFQKGRTGWGKIIESKATERPSGGTGYLITYEITDPLGVITREIRYTVSEQDKEYLEKNQPFRIVFDQNADIYLILRHEIR